LLNKVHIILVEPSHPGNIGAAARAMKNMALEHLRLVSPEVFPHREATTRAAGADDLLANAKVFSNLNEAIADCHVVFGTSARSRSLPWPLITPNACADQIAGELHDQKIAIVFGRESSGLKNEELALCQYHVNIPTTESFSSLNLGAAVQVMAYEIYRAHIDDSLAPALENNDSPLANAGQLASFYAHLQSTLVDLDFLDPKQPKLLMQRLQRLFNRTHLEEKEIHILRGILSAIDRSSSSHIE